MAQRHRREAAAPEASAALDERGEALAKLLTLALGEYEVEIGAAVDEVVVVARPDQVPDISRLVKESAELSFDYLRCITVVDYEERLEVNYHLFSLDKRHKMVVKTSNVYLSRSCIVVPRPPITT